MNMGLFDAFVNAANLGYQISKDAHLTGAQREANQFSHDEARLAYERALQADSTKYQRQVSDMRAAGLNPMLAAGGSAGSVQSSPASSVSPSGGNVAGALGLILQKQQLDLQRKIADAEIQKTKAETRNIEARTEETGLNIGFFRDTQELRKVLLGDQHERNEWEKQIGLRGVQVKEDNQRMLEQNAEHYNKMLDEQADLISQQSLSEPLKREMYRANAREANQNAAYRAAMVEVDKALTEAKTDTEKKELQLLSIEARFKNGVYTPAYIKAVCDEAKAQAEYKSIMADYMKGDYHRASEDLQKIFHLLEKAGTAPNLFGLMPLDFINNEAKVLPALNH